MEDLKSRVKNVLAAELRISPDRLTDDLTLDDLGVSSLTSAELIVAVERALGRSIDPMQVAIRLTPESRVADFIDIMLASATSA